MKWATLGLVLATIVSCGDSESTPPPPPPDCNATTCPTGCCDGNGGCQPWTVLTCGITGSAGESCVVCATGQSCVDGRCATGGGACGPTTCPMGCCDRGQCVTGTTAIQCGSGGAACSICKAPQQCVGKKCSSVQCGPDTCPSGCCDASGACLAGTTEQACGSGGAACAGCGPDQVCSAGGCITPSTGCNAQSCPDGCCDKGSCVKPATQSKCGKGGAACTSCGSSQECVAGKCECTAKSCASGCCTGGSCSAGSEVGACGSGGAPCQQCKSGEVCANGACGAGCSAATCPGCCQGQSCNFGGATDVTACGTGGTACQQCASGQSCQQGTCNNPIVCSPSSCKNGCCKAGNCESGTASDACGSGGSACIKCSTFEYCGSASCQVKPTSTWKVTLSKISLSSDLTIGWDVGGSPDPYLVFTTGSQTKQSSTKSDTYTPLYGEYLLTASASDLTAAIKFVIWDEDYGYDDKIAECDYKFSGYQLQKGQATVYGCPGDPQNTYVLDTVFTFSLATP